jgi:hypothetical protein
MTAEDVLTTCGKFNYRAMLASEQVRSNAAETARRVSLLLNSFGSDRKLTSGFRDRESNARAHGAKASAHIEGRAVDIEDHDGRLALYCVQNQDLLAHIQLWVENPQYTKGWVHVQTRPTTERVFKPY